MKKIFVCLASAFILSDASAWADTLKRDGPMTNVLRELNVYVKEKRYHVQYISTANLRVVEKGECHGRCDLSCDAEATGGKVQRQAEDPDKKVYTAILSSIPDATAEKIIAVPTGSRYIYPISRIEY